MGCDNLHKKKKNRAQRLKVQRQESIRVLVLTEGFSEQIYFMQIRTMLRLGTLEVKRNIRSDANSIVQDAISLAEKASNSGNEYNYIFCVFDLDTVINVAEKKEFINTLNNFTLDDTKIFPIYSYPCIEIWFILHYELHDAPFSKIGKKSIGDTAKSYLKNKFLSKYSENDTKSIETIVSLYETAINNSQRLAKQQKECDTINPITTVHKLLIFFKNMRSSPSNCHFEKDIENFIESCL